MATEASTLFIQALNLPKCLSRFKARISIFFNMNKGSTSISQFHPTVGFERGVPCSSAHQLPAASTSHHAEMHAFLQPKIVALTCRNIQMCSSLTYCVAPIISPSCMKPIPRSLIFPIYIALWAPTHAADYQTIDRIPRMHALDYLCQLCVHLHCIRRLHRPFNNVDPDLVADRALILFSTSFAISQ